MAILDKFKKTSSLQTMQAPNSSTNNTSISMEPITILVGGQFNIFISELVKDRLNVLNEIEKKAFETLWYTACVDIDGFGNNIWNLKYGSFKIYNEEDITISYEKKQAEVKDSYIEEGRAIFAYQSKDGNLIIKQNDRNKQVFLVYVSDTISKRLLDAFRIAEEKALGIVSDKQLKGATR